MMVSSRRDREDILVPVHPLEVERILRGNHPRENPILAVRRWVLGRTRGKRPQGSQGGIQNARLTMAVVLPLQAHPRRDIFWPKCANIAAVSASFPAVLSLDIVAWTHQRVGLRTDSL